MGNSEPGQRGLKAPFPFFGGKATQASLIWDRLGDVHNFVEPFFGSGAVLLARPDCHGWWVRIETVNDKDGFICNFYRALQADPGGVQKYADWPALEPDLHARHSWLVGQKDSLQCRLEGNPDYYDVKIAGWWVWGMALWIGGGFCSGDGPWRVVEGEDGIRQLLRSGDPGQGVNRQLIHLGDAGNGIHRKGIAAEGGSGLLSYFEQLAFRLKRVRVACGDWTRVCGPSPTFSQGLTGVFLDPPYSHATGRVSDLYREEKAVNHDVLAWALELGQHPLMRIALCGYDGEGYDVLEEYGWTCHSWEAHGGYANQGNGSGKQNKLREKIWFSPKCLPPQQPQLDLWA